MDYRALNNCTKMCSYPLPRIDDSLDQLFGCGYLSTFDMKSGFRQIPMHEKDEEKTAFASRKGFFKCNVMLFGLANALAIF